MKIKFPSYGHHAVALYDYYKDLKIEDDDSLRRKFNLVSAGLLNYLPQISENKYEEIFKNILLHQHLSMIEQQEVPLLDNLIIKGPATDILEYLTVESALICTFHLGSYRLLNLLLAKHGIPFSLVIAKNVITEQGKTFKEIYNQINANPLNLIDAESPNAALKMIRELKKGTSLVIYVGGNTGSGNPTLHNENSCCLSFLNQQIIARKGIGFLAHAANVPVIPVFCYRESISNIILQFSDMIMPDAKKERGLFTQNLMQRLYDVVAPYIEKYPEQWEAWLYLYKVARIINPIKEKNIPNNRNTPEQLTFNSKEFGLFKVAKNNYIFHRADYTAYPISQEIYTALNQAVQKTLNRNSISVNLKRELYLNRVLITV